jgi:hypothetical protein
MRDHTAASPKFHCAECEGLTVRFAAHGGKIYVDNRGADGLLAPVFQVLHGDLAIYPVWERNRVIAQMIDACHEPADKALVSLPDGAEIIRASPLSALTNICLSLVDVEQSGDAPELQATTTQARRVALWLLKQIQPAAEALGLEYRAVLDSLGLESIETIPWARGLLH